MKQNKFRYKLNGIKFRFDVFFLTLKKMFFPEKDVAISRDYAMDLYSELVKNLNRNDIINHQIYELKEKVLNAKNCNVSEIKNFDFELFSTRFNGDFLVLNAQVEFLRSKIFTLDESKNIYVYKSFMKNLKQNEDEMNLKIELMNKIERFSDLTREQISRKELKDFRLRTSKIFYD